MNKFIQNGAIAEYKEIDPTFKGRIGRIPPNATSVAMHCRLGFHAALLGADLEDNDDPLNGWYRAADFAVEARLVKSTLLKIPHHGSKGAHSDKAWAALCCPPLSAVVTPFRKGTHLPTVGDQLRIKKMAGIAYLTHAPQDFPEVKHKTASKLMQGLDSSQHIGGVQFRINMCVETDRWKANPFGGAILL